MHTFKNYPPGIEIVGGTIEVTGHLNGRSLIASLWRTLFTSSLAQDGDHLIDQSLVLLQRHLKLMSLQDQNIISHYLDVAKDLRCRIEDQTDISVLRKNLVARNYKRRARKTFKIVKRASSRALENLLRNQMDEAQRPPGPPPGDGSGRSPGTGTVASDPFGDAHEISRITDIDVNDTVRVDMSAYQDEATGEEAAVFDVTGRDRSVKHVIAFAGNRTDRGASPSTASAPAAVGLNLDDVPSPLLIAAAPLDDHREDEQGENLHLIGAQRAENSGIDSELTFSTSGNKYTRFFWPE